MANFILKQGHIVDPSSGMNMVADIEIENRQVTRIGTLTDSNNATLEIDISGLFVFPGLIDCHVHFRDPGFTHKENIESGSNAALAGGFTSVIQMPNTSPPLSTPQMVENYSRLEPLHCYVAATITKDRLGKECVDFDSLKKAGAVAFTDDGSPVESDGIMEEALSMSAKLGFRVMSHAENLELASGGSIIEGEVADKLKIKGIKRNAESSMVKRDIELARNTGGNIHICHVSTKESVEAIRNAKSDGVNITAEVTPHHLLLTVEAVVSHGAMAKMNPPLAYEEDRQACVEALIDGTIDIVVTDHAPHTIEEKLTGLEAAPFGISGIEISFPLLYTFLVEKKLMSLSDLITKMSWKPSKLFNIGDGTVRQGASANLAIFDLNDSYVINPDDFYSLGHNTPFRDWTVRGITRCTIVDGVIRYPFDD